MGNTVYVGALIGSLFTWEKGQLSEVAPLDAKFRHMVKLTQKFNDFNPKPSSGSIVKVAPDLTTSYVVAPKDHLNYPDGIAFGPDGSLRHDR